MSARLAKSLVFILGVLFSASLPAQVTLTQGTNFTIDASADGRLAIDLLGGIWVLPENGGAAEPVSIGVLPARRPRWSPDGTGIVYEARSAERNELRLYRFATGEVESLGNGRYSDQQPDWHPDGDRIVFSSQRHDAGLDLWELDLETRLSWRISHLPGDETEPAWSADGRGLVYVREHDGQWSLMLRRFGEPDRALVTSNERLSSPAWRPDGSLISFTRHNDDGLTISMLILSEPLLERTLIDGDDLFPGPVAWPDRQRMLYAANGVIRKRNFNSWVSRTVPFRATIGKAVAQGTRKPTVRELPTIDEPAGRRVLRAARLFDGIGGGYREQQDIVIEAGRILAIEDRRERGNVVVFDMGDLTVLPGFIDSYASLPPNADASLGPVLLSFGITTLVSKHESAASLNERWAGAETPGPRVLPAASITDTRPVRPWLVTLSGDMNTGLAQRDAVARWQRSGVPVLAETWQAGLGSGASLLLGATTLPASPEGHRYQDMQLSTGSAALTIISGLADALTPGLKPLLASRQAALLPRTLTPTRRFSTPPQLAASPTSVIIGSKPNGLAPGVASHAEFRALAAAGLRPERILRAAGVDAASALGLGLQLGRIAPGSRADLVVVDGDPLAEIGDTLNVVAVVRNGRFFSTIRLIEMLQTTQNVE